MHYIFYIPGMSNVKLMYPVIFPSLFSAVHIYNPCDSDGMNWSCKTCLSWDVTYFKEGGQLVSFRLFCIESTMHW